PPPVVKEERGSLPDLVTEAQNKSGGGLEVELQQDVVALCPPASRVPYEVLIANGYGDAGSVFESGELPTALLVLRSVIRRLRAASIAAPRFRPLSFACLISITVSRAFMS